MFLVVFIVGAASQDCHVAEARAELAVVSIAPMGWRYLRPSLIFARLVAN